MIEDKSRLECKCCDFGCSTKRKMIEHLKRKHSNFYDREKIEEMDEDNSVRIHKNILTVALWDLQDYSESMYRFIKMLWDNRHAWTEEDSKDWEFLIDEAMRIKQDCESLEATLEIYEQEWVEDLREGIKQAEEGEGIPHKELKKKPEEEPDNKNENN